MARREAGGWRTFLPNLWWGVITLGLALATLSTARANAQTPLTSPVWFALGPGGTDVVPHQLIRTAADRVYIFANQQYSPLLRVYWTIAPGLPITTTDFAGFAQVSESGLPISVDAVYDGARFIHVLVNTNAGALKTILGLRFIPEICSRYEMRNDLMSHRRPPSETS